MKIKITKEADDVYFAEVIGEPGVCVQGDTPEHTLEYLADVYQKIMEIRAERIAVKTKNIREKFCHADKSFFSTIPFRSLELAI